MRFRKPIHQARRIIATVAAATLLSLSIGGVPTALAKEPTAEDIARCERETAAYNAAWASSWAAANNKPASQAPPPPVPYKCGPVPDDAPPPTVPNAPDAPEINIPKAPDRDSEPSSPAEPGKPGGGTASPSTTPAPISNRDGTHRIGQNVVVPPGVDSSSESDVSAEVDRLLKEVSEAMKPVEVPNPEMPPIIDAVINPFEVQHKAQASGCDISQDGCDSGDNGRNSYCVGRVGKNCHRYDTSIEYIDGTPYRDYQSAIATCSTDSGLGCSISRSSSNEWSVGATGGLSGEVVSGALSMTYSESVEIAVQCSLPPGAEERRMIARPERYKPRYSVAKRYHDGDNAGKLAERSSPQNANEINGIYCQKVNV